MMLKKYVLIAIPNKLRSADKHSMYRMYLTVMEAARVLRCHLAAQQQLDFLTASLAKAL